jgi:hypothetical protein
VEDYYALTKRKIEKKNFKHERSNTFQDKEQTDGEKPKGTQKWRHMWYKE